MEETARRFFVHLQGIWKRFGPIVAVRDASLSIRRGEVLGLVGDNGAGKSSLMKILSGVLRPDSGKIIVEDRFVQFTSAGDARRCGIDMIYQDYGLVGSLSVLENIFLGRELIYGALGGMIGVLDRSAMKRRSLKALSEVGFSSIEVTRTAEQLSGGERQAVSICRALVLGPDLIIMDEPTAALSVKEVGRVLQLVRQLRSADVAVVFISHRLDDVLAVCDRIVVLRRGRIVATLNGSETNGSEVVAHMFGDVEARA